MKSKGQVANVRVCDMTERRLWLLKKLTEEVEKFLLSGDQCGLVDILEVVLNLAHGMGIDSGYLECLRVAKLHELGGYGQNFVLADTPMSSRYHGDDTVTP